LAGNDPIPENAKECGDKERQRRDKSQFAGQKVMPLMVEYRTGLEKVLGAIRVNDAAQGCRIDTQRKGSDKHPHDRCAEAGLKRFKRYDFLHNLPAAPHPIRGDVLKACRAPVEAYVDDCLGFNRKGN
jgi:hypothetical protein